MKRKLFGYSLQDVEKAMKQMSGQKTDLIDHNDHLEEEIRLLSIKLDEAKAAVVAEKKRTEANLKELELIRGSETVQEETRNIDRRQAAADNSDDTKYREEALRSNEEIRQLTQKLNEATAAVSAEKERAEAYQEELKTLRSSMEAQQAGKQDSTVSAESDGTETVKETEALCSREEIRQLILKLNEAEAAAAAEKEKTETYRKELETLRSSMEDEKRIQKLNEERTASEAEQTRTEASLKETEILRGRDEVRQLNMKLEEAAAAAMEEKRRAAAYQKLQKNLWSNMKKAVDSLKTTLENLDQLQEKHK